MIMQPGATTVSAPCSRLLVGVACGLASLGGGSVLAQDPVDTARDDALRAALTHTAERILLPERCGECHAAEFEVWETTAHATGFDTLHRSERAKEIYRRLGLRVIKRVTDETTPACLSCHYTPVVRRDRLRAGAGVTCESCHGPAREWISIHNSYGVAESDFQQAARLETAAHRAQRITDSTAAGMRRPSQIYDVAANCFACHTVPQEELVNRAGHSTGSDFELVAWSDRIRHNFLESYKTADGRTNADRPREWKRLLYVVGRALDLEYALRGVAAATQDDLYFAAMSDRVGVAVDELFEINDRLYIAEMQTIIAVVRSADLAIGNRAALLVAADAIRRATQAFIAAAEGSALAVLDPLWDPSVEDTEPPGDRVTEVVALVQDPPSLPDGARDGSVAAAARAASPDAAAPGGGGDPVPGIDPAPVVNASPPARAAVQAPAPAAAQIVTLPRPPWRELPAHEFVKVPCGRCHNTQEKWWRNDPHSRTARPFRSGENAVLEIATAYGVAVDDVARGTQTCMWCHGTIGSNPTRRVRAGVGCQRCHGPGADYLEPHETGSHAESVALGLTDLRNPALQAATCAGCHYVTDSGACQRRAPGRR